MTITVVLADDHPIVRLGIRGLLEKDESIQVVGEATTGREAVQLVQRHQPDVLVLDMSLPELNGLEVIQKLQEMQSAVKVLALSAYDTDEYITGILERGAKGYLLKGDAPKRIVEAVEEVAAGRGYFSQSLIPKLLLPKPALEKTNAPTKTNAFLLTQRELEVLTKLVQGWDNQRIAEDLCVEIRTIKFHTQNIYEKFQVKNRTEAILYALEHRLVPTTYPAPSKPMRSPDISYTM